MCAITNWWDNWKWLWCAWKKAVKNIPGNPTKAQTKYKSPTGEKQTGENWKVPKLRKQTERLKKSRHEGWQTESWRGLRVSFKAAKHVFQPYKLGYVHTYTVLGFFSLSLKKKSPYNHCFVHMKMQNEIMPKQQVAIKSWSYRNVGHSEAYKQ